MANQNEAAAAALEAAALAVLIMEEEEEDLEHALLVLAQVTVREIMELEEPWIDAEALEASWVYVNVNINEYHLFPDPVFKMHFRMSREVFEKLIQTVGNYLTAKGRLRRRRTPLQDILLMFVWIMATPDSFRSVALRFGRRPSTLWDFYAYMVETLRQISQRYIKWPSEEERRDIKETFQRATGFPGVIGCIDCTHVYITAPVQDAAQYVNRHDTYSINVQAVVDNQLLVRHLHAGEVGSMNDKRVFRRSPLCHDILKVGEDRLLNADEHLLGDGGYTLTDFMMIPFPNDARLTEQQALFNKKLSQCRVRVENAFGRAKEKWRRLKFLHARNPAIVTDHITASFTLHNFIILNGEEVWQGAALERPIRRNEVLGNEVFDDIEDDGEDLDEEQQADQHRLDDAAFNGVEYRLFLMNHLLE